MRLQRNMHSHQQIGKENSRKKEKEEEEDDDGEDVSFCEQPGGGRMAGALPQSPDVQPSRHVHACGTGKTIPMDVLSYIRPYIWAYNRLVLAHTCMLNRYDPYIWTYNRLVVHTHSYPCGIGTNYVLTTVSTYCSVHMPHTPACVYEHQSHRTHSQP